MWVLARALLEAGLCICGMMTNTLKDRKIQVEKNVLLHLLFHFCQWASPWLTPAMPGAYRAVTGPGKQRNAL